MLNEHSEKGEDDITYRNIPLVNAPLYIQDPFEYTLQIVTGIPTMISRLIYWMRVKGINPPRLKRTVRWRLSCFGLYMQRLTLHKVYPLTVRVENLCHAVTFRVKTMPISHMDTYGARCPFLKSVSFPLLLFQWKWAEKPTIDQTLDTQSGEKVVLNEPCSRLTFNYSCRGWRAFVWSQRCNVIVTVKWLQRSS